MKFLALASSVLFSVSVMAAPVVTHKNCNVAVELSTTEDGLNLFMAQSVKNAFKGKGYTLVDQAEVTAENPAMGLRIDLNTALLGKKFRRGECSATISLRNDILVNEEGDMRLTSEVSRKGNLANVGKKCIKAIAEELASYPVCQALRPVVISEPVIVEPVEPAPVEETPTL